MKKEKQIWLLEAIAAGRYAATKEGVVYSRARSSEQIMKQSTDTYGYSTVGLTWNGRMRNTKVHQVVWLTTNGGFDERLQMNHKDGVKANNHISNLELVTNSENILHAFKLGLKTQKGIANNHAKLTDAEVLAIKRALAGLPIPRKELAFMFGVSRATIDNIANEKSWVAK